MEQRCYLDQFHLALVCGAGAVEQCAGLVKVCLQLETLVIQNRKLGLHAAIFRGLLHSFFHCSSQLSLVGTQENATKRNTIPLPLVSVFQDRGTVNQAAKGKDKSRTSIALL